LMGNHYHLMIGTPEANLTKGMRHLMGSSLNGSTAATSAAAISSRAGTKRS
jgi:hypothetical protein